MYSLTVPVTVLRFVHLPFQKVFHFFKASLCVFPTFHTLVFQPATPDALAFIPPFTACLHPSMPITNLSPASHFFSLHPCPSLPVHICLLPARLKKRKTFLKYVFELNFYNHQRPWRTKMSKSYPTPYAACFIIYIHRHAHCCPCLPSPFKACFPSSRPVSHFSVSQPCLGLSSPVSLYSSLPASVPNAV